MRFEEVLPALREGKKIKRSSWGKDTYFYKNHQGTFIVKNGGADGYYYNLSYLLNSDDWEIIKETKKVKLRDLTPEQYKEWRVDNCLCPVRIKLCNGCPFNPVRCYPDPEYNPWYLNKDLFSDKFLDQEVEIEEE